MFTLQIQFDDGLWVADIAALSELLMVDCHKDGGSNQSGIAAAMFNILDAMADYIGDDRFDENYGGNWNQVAQNIDRLALVASQKLVKPQNE